MNKNIKMKRESVKSYLCQFMQVKPKCPVKNCEISFIEYYECGCLTEAYACAMDTVVVMKDKFGVDVAIMSVVEERQGA